LDIDEAFRDGKEDIIISHLNAAYDVETDPDELLLKAAHYGREDVIKACLDAGINPDINEALVWACGSGRMAPIKLLVSAGSNVNIIDKFGKTPIIKSAGQGKLNEIKFLLKSGAETKGALLAAVNGEYIKVVEYLLAIDIDLEEVADNGLSALTIACASHTKKASQIALMLINVGADVNFVRESDEQTPLQFAAGSSSLEVIQSLIDNGAEVDGPKGTSQTALMLAARANSAEHVEILLNNGADPNLKCGLPWANNSTARGLAEMEKCKKVIDYFERHTEI